MSKIVSTTKSYSFKINFSNILSLAITYSSSNVHCNKQNTPSPIRLGANAIFLSWTYFSDMVTALLSQIRCFVQLKLQLSILSLFKWITNKNKPWIFFFNSFEHERHWLTLLFCIGVFMPTNGLNAYFTEETNEWSKKKEIHWFILEVQFSKWVTCVQLWLKNLVNNWYFFQS